ncbi:MAG TPA: PAS domain S-box protein [Thermoleophilaceae bacterium]
MPGSAGSAVQQSQGGTKILIVDDQDDVRLALGAVLALDGWETEEAASGEEALARVGRSRHFAGLVVDYRMPGLNGLEVARRIRGTGFERPIIICSAYLSPGIEEEAGAVGARTVSKDDLSRLREAIRQLRPPERHSGNDEAGIGLAAIVESSDDAIIGLTLQGIVATWNAAAERIYGYSAGEMLGRPVWLLVPANHDNDEPEILDKVRRGERVDPYEAVRETKTGHHIDVSLMVSPIKDRQGKIIGASTIARDVTARRRAEERFRGLLESAPDAVVIVGTDGHIALVNRRTEELFGYRREELLGKPVEVLVPERFRNRHPAVRDRYFGDPQVRPMGAGLDLFAVRKDRTEFPVEISLSPFQTEGGTVVSAAIRDVTERKKAEEKFRALLEAAPDAMVIVGTDGLIELVNRRTEELFGYRREELLGKPVEVLVPERLKDRHPLRDDYFADPQVRPMGAGLDLFAVRKDRTEFPVEISLSPLTTETGTIVSAAIRDVTGRKRAEERLRLALAGERDAVERLRDLDRLKDEFLSTVSHELRTPLTVIGALAEVMRNASAAPRQDQADLVERIFENAADMSGMIEQLLDYSRLEAGKVALEHRPVHLREAVLRCVELSQAAIGKRDTSLEVPDQLEVQADKRAFERILVNLLTNAAKYSSDGSTIRVIAWTEDGEAVVAVQDDGIGIPSEEQERVFERFYQGSVVSGKRGTGIGLSIVQRYVELLSGRVWVESAPGRGSTFLFTLPLSEGSKERSNASDRVAGR